MNVLQEDILNVWNIERFKIFHTPQLIKEFNSSILGCELPNILDMPIKLPFGKFALPPLNTFALNTVATLVGYAIEHEQKINSNWENYFCYLTTNCGIVEKGKSQRNSGAHFDGMQGVRYAKKFPVCHQYLISSSNPTVYYPHAFDFSILNDNKHNFFLECDRQKDISKSFKAKINCLYLQTAYCVHESPVAQETCKRVFVRIEFSLKKFNRLGNSINPNLLTNWNYEEQPIPKYLT
jgi:hypothetical protein